jgi:hypothetical protein
MIVLLVRKGLSLIDEKCGEVLLASGGKVNHFVGLQRIGSIAKISDVPEGGQVAGIHKILVEFAKLVFVSECAAGIVDEVRPEEGAVASVKDNKWPFRMRGAFVAADTFLFFGGFGLA